MTTPIEKRLTVPLAPGEAFDLFTRGIDRWWPKDSHSHSARDGKSARRITVEPREGGRILEERHDGGTSAWATITEWRPGEALALDWYVGQPEGEEPTQVRVTFTATEGGTRVDLVHDGFEPCGVAAETACAGSARRWELALLRCYGGAVALVA